MESGKNLSVWESSGHRILYIPYTYKHVFKFEVDNWNPYKVHKFILNYWHFSFLIVGIYVLVSWSVYFGKYFFVSRLFMPFRH